MIESLSSTRSASPPGLAEFVLRGCFALRCFALGDVYLWHQLERDSDIFGVLYFHRGWPEHVALSLDNWGMAATTAIGLSSVFVPLCLKNSRRIERWRRIEIWLLGFVVLWELLFAVCLTVRGGRFLSDISLASHALRIGVPLALLLTDLARSSPQLSTSSLLVLRWATAITFLAHGWKAWQLSPVFVSMVIGAWQFFCGADLPQPVAERIVQTIGILDLVSAALLMTVRWPWIVLYMAAWATISALGRTLGVSEANYPETLLRMVHAGGPLALFLEWRQRRKPQLATLSGDHSLDP